MNLGVFVYDFPHRKSQEVLLRLWLEGCDLACVVAAPRVQLAHTRSSAKLRTKIREGALVHPRVISERLGVPYFVLPHNEPDTARVLREHEVDLGVVGGARILRPPTLHAPSIGILNLHPGLIPEVRGLDALKWAVYKGLPPGVTAHLIDERVDAGWIVARRVVRVYEDDTWIDLSIRLAQVEIDTLASAVAMLDADRAREHYTYVEGGENPGPMPDTLESDLVERFAAWRAQMVEETAT